jgi:glycosyltransferase involved in cell wall biosynthesis
MIGQDERGLAFTPGDADALAERVRRVWNDSLLSDRLTAAALEHVHRHHSSDAALRSLIEIYSELLG